MWEQIKNHETFRYDYNVNHLWFHFHHNKKVPTKSFLKNFFFQKLLLDYTCPSSLQFWWHHYRCFHIKLSQVLQSLTNYKYINFFSFSQSLFESWYREKFLALICRISNGSELRVSRVSIHVHVILTSHATPMRCLENLNQLLFDICSVRI